MSPKPSSLQDLDFPKLFRFGVTGGTTAAVQHAQVSSVALDPNDSNSVWVCNRDNESVSVIDVAGGVATHQITVGVNPRSLAFSADGKLLAVGGGAPGKLGEARLFDFEKGELSKVVGTSSDVVLDVRFSPDGKSLAVAAADSSIRIENPPGFGGGAWTAWPFFESGMIIVSSMNEGLFIVRPQRPVT